MACKVLCLYEIDIDEIVLVLSVTTTTTVSLGKNLHFVRHDGFVVVAAFGGGGVIVDLVLLERLEGVRALEEQGCEPQKMSY